MSPEEHLKKLKVEVLEPLTVDEVVKGLREGRPIGELMGGQGSGSSNTAPIAAVAAVAPAARPNGLAAHAELRTKVFDVLEGRPTFEPTPPKPKSRFILQPFEQIALGSKAPYLVKGLIPREGLVVVYGAPKCGKSFWTFDLVMHVAMAWEYRGRRVKQGTVVYCAFEGAEGFKARIEAFRQNRLPQDAGAVPFHFLAASLILAKDRAALIQSIEISLGETRPAVVVLDTLNRSIGGSESDDRDMPAYIAAAGAIQDAFKCAVIIIHHSGLDKGRPRGHTSLTGAADVQIVVKRDAAGNIISTVEWAKDGPEGDAVVSRLRLVEVGVDEDGDVITSCLIEVVDGEAARAAAKDAKANSLPKSARLALDALHEAIGELGKEAPASSRIPVGVKVVTLSQWRTIAYRRGISASEEPRARQTAFQRAHESLLAGGKIGVWDDNVWVLQ